MSLILNVEAQRWRAHLADVVARTPGLVPVAKGNGYGFGLARLASEASRLADIDTLAVGTYEELTPALERFAGDVLVLTPWRPFGAAEVVDPNPRLIHTISRAEDLIAVTEADPAARYVLELRTTMLRHGMTGRELRALNTDNLAGLEGVAFHLPLSAGSNLAQARRLMTDVIAANLGTTTVWVSHLAPADLKALQSAYPDYTIRPRIGTALWLGDRGALRVTATVLDLHSVEKGDSFGYRSRTAPKAGTIVVVSGGTSHGIGLEAPRGDESMKSRAISLARGGMDAVGFVRSPYSIFGKQRLFAEPPHMQASMLFLPAGSLVPSIGDEIDVRVRFTATDVDQVRFT